MLYPLRFEPIFQRYLWGGQRLATHLNKACGPLSAAESWEIVDHGDHQSKVRFGPLKGLTLNALLQKYTSQLVGNATWNSIHSPATPTSLRGRFPLLFKFLDANQALSIQVHPDDAYASKMNPPDLGKTEAWFVMHAEPGSRIYSGLKQGVTRPDLAQAIVSGTTETLMHQFEPQVGDVIYIPAGTMHALGAGLVIAEIQQASNTTFRVFDWNRVDANGVPRPLHIEQALAVTRFDHGPAVPLRIAAEAATCGQGFSRQELIRGDKFVLTQHRLQQVQNYRLPGLDSFRILVVTQGELLLENDPSEMPLRMGDTALIPADAELAVVSKQNETAFLDITS